MKNKIIIESLSMDLLRIALGYHRGSDKMAKRFVTEAIKRIEEIDMRDIKPYFANNLKKLKKLLLNDDKKRVSEDTLMYSTICKNYSKHFC